MEPSSRWNRRIWLIALALLVAWIGFNQFLGPHLGLGRGLPAPELTNPGPGTASYDWRIEDLNGNSVDLQSYRGKPIFLNLWATWCPPCVAEIPTIERLATNPRLKGVSFLAVSTEDADTVRQFVRDRHHDFPAFSASDPPPPVFQSDAIPATFIIAPDGRIVTHHIGSAQWDDPAVVDLLEKLAQ